MRNAEGDVLLQCLILVAKAHGLPATTESLTAGLPLGDDGLRPDLLGRASQRAGLNGHMKSVPLVSIPEVVCPAILILENKKACVYLGKTSDGKARVIYPQFVHSPVEDDFDSVQARYTGHCFLARPRFTFDERVTSGNFKREGHWFWAAVKANKSVYVDVLIAAFFINVFALAVPLFTMNVYDRVVPNAAFDTFWVMAIGVMLVLVADVILKTLRGHFIDIANRRIDSSLSASIMERTLGMRLEHRPVSVGNFAVNLRSFETLRDLLTTGSVTALVDLPFALLFFGVIGWVAPALLIPVLVFVVLVLGFALYMRPRLRRLIETTYKASALRNATLIESLAGMDTLKEMGAESIMQRKWEDATRFLASVGAYTAEVCHPFHLKAATRTGAKLPLIGAERRGDGIVIRSR